MGQNPARQQETPWLFPVTCGYYSQEEFQFVNFYSVNLLGRQRKQDHRKLRRRQMLR